MSFEEREEARADFIAQNQEYTEDDINELKEELKELKEITQVIISVTRHQRLKDRTIERFIDLFKKNYGFTEEDFEPRSSWIEKDGKLG